MTPRLPGAVPIAATSAVAGIVGVLAPLNPTLRAGFLVAFVATGPGFGLTGLIEVRGIAARWTVAIVTSLAIALIISTILVMARVWWPPLVYGLLMAATLGGALAQAVVIWSGRRGAEGMNQQGPP